MIRAPLDVARQAGGNLLHAARRLVGEAVLPRRDRFWLQLRVDGLDEQVGAGIPFRPPTALDLFETLETLASAGRDPRVAGVLVRVAGPVGGFSRALTLHRALASLRAGGVPVAVWSETYDAASLLVASAADRVWLPESGHVFLVGLRLESMFLRGVLERLGVAPEVVRVGRYKSAGERFTRDRLSPESREQLEALADDVFEMLVRCLAEGRGLSPERVRELIDAGPHPARAAAEAGLVSGCLYPDELDAALAELGGRRRDVPPGEPPVRRVDAPVYHALVAADPGWRPLPHGLPRVAYVVARGLVVRGRGHRGIASEAYGELFEGLRRDERVRGVVLRIDSGGGDAIASDLLWRALRQLSDDKPVVATLGDVVASGGYYLASAANEVLAEAATITGSIGVVGGKLNVEDLYRRVGVAKDGVERGARAGLLSESRAFTPDEKNAIRGGMQALYDTFLDRVATGRGLSLGDTRKVAEGRVWSGQRALTLGLVDALGGPLEALAALRARAGLGPDAPLQIERLPQLPRLPSLVDVRRLLPG